MLTFTDALKSFRTNPSRESARTLLDLCHVKPSRYASLDDGDEAMIRWELTEDSDPSKALADHYAETWNAMERQGLEPSEDALWEAEEELEDSDWVVHRGDDQWEVSHVGDFEGPERNQRGSPDRYRWVTIGGRAEEPDKKHVGGFPVEIDADGTILKSRAPGLQGKNISGAKSHFKDARSNEEPSEEKPKWNAQSTAVKEIAAATGLPKNDVIHVIAQAAIKTGIGTAKIAGRIARTLGKHALGTVGIGSGKKASMVLDLIDDVLGKDNVVTKTAMQEGVGEMPKSSSAVLDAADAVFGKDNPLSSFEQTKDEPKKPNGPIDSSLVLDAIDTVAGKGNPITNLAMSGTEKSRKPQSSLVLDILDAVAGKGNRLVDWLMRQERAGEVLRYQSRRELLDAINAAAGECETEPTDAQKESGNYKKGHVTIQGLPITIENPKGSIRRGKDWQVTMRAHYGYVKRTESEADGDHVDVFIGPNPESEIVFVIDQQKPGGRFDEHKCMLGYTTAEQAKAGYLANYSAGWTGYGGMKAMPIAVFKEWIKDGDTGSRAEYQRIVYEQVGQVLRYGGTWVAAESKGKSKKWKNLSTGEVRYQPKMPGDTSGRKKAVREGAGKPRAAKTPRVVGSGTTAAKLQDHATELTPVQQKSAKASFRALMSKHKDQVLGRLDELVDDALTGLGKAKDEPGREKWRAKLGQYRQMLEWAGAGVKPKVESKGDNYWGNKETQPYYRPGANPTVDNVITRDGPDGLEVLLIQRKKGTVEGEKWALPGGFHDTAAKKGEPWKAGHETAEAAAVRELAEETGLDASVLQAHMKHVGEYEGGGRDPRDNEEAWSKSNAFILHLPPELANKAVSGQDDAQDAQWVPLSKIKDLPMAFDHAKIMRDAMDVTDRAQLIQQVIAKFGGDEQKYSKYSTDQLRKMLEGGTDGTENNKLGGRGETTPGSGGDAAGAPVGTPVGSALAGKLPAVGEGHGDGLPGLPAGAGESGAGLPVGPDGAGGRSVPSEGTGDGGTPAGAGGRSGGGTGGDGSTGGSGGSAESSAQQAVEAVVRAKPTPETPTDLSAGNFRYSTRQFMQGGLKAKFARNVEAIRTLKNIQAEGRTTATPAEQEVLAQYIGWGQFPAAFRTEWQREDGDLPYEEQQRLKTVLTEEQWEARFAPKKWEKEKQLLENLLSPDEYRSARKSTLNAHYTHPDIVDAHWKMAQRLGYKGGRFLETSAGIGYYLGMMPPELAGRTHGAAVELDSVTADMLKLLYPGSHVAKTGLEKFACPDNFYDLVASNVPFGDYHVFDPRYSKYNANIHDYFFLKSLDLAKPGGLVMHVTSTGTLDKKDSKIRRAMMEQADLVSAIRFPGSAHKKNAGTEVVTDLLILRKKNSAIPEVTDETPDEAQPKRQGFTGTTVDSLGRLYHWRDGKRVPGPSWDEITTVKDPAGGEPIPVNQYFADHPEQILGQLDRTGTMYRGDSKNVSSVGDFKKLLDEAIERLPQNVLATEVAEAPVERLAADDAAKEGANVLKGGKLYIYDRGTLVEQKVDKKELAKIQAQLEMRDVRNELVAVQRDGLDSAPARKRLNEQYDAFVAEHGFLNDKKNRKLLGDDPDGPNILALEHYDEKTKKGTKADILVKDTIRSGRVVEKANNVTEAIGVSLHMHGQLDMEYMSKLLGQSKADVGSLLRESGLAFEDPKEGWKQSDQYLSGNVRRKLIEAQAAAAVDPAFQPNVDALSKVQPVDIPSEQITIKLGSKWIPQTDIQNYVTSLIGGRPEYFDVRVNPVDSSWTVALSKGRYSSVLDSEAAQLWQTDRVSFLRIFNAALNNKSVTVNDSDGDGGTVVNKEATAAANEKISQLRDHFTKEWVMEDEERRERLCRYYNDNFNNIVPIKYNGSHQTFPGMNPQFEPYPHQKDFVWQVVTTGKGLAAHEVGLGKAMNFSAKLLTPSGWTTMGEIKLGDDIIAGDGSRTKVIGVFPQGKKEVFRVTFSDGASTVCCDEHLWLTSTYRERNQAINFKRFAKSEWECAEPKVRTLKEIRETLVSPHLGAKNHSIPIVGQVDFYASPVPVAPYLLGVLLGDGHLAGSITITKPDEEIIDYIKEDGLPSGVEVRERYGDRCKTWGLTRVAISGNNNLRDLLTEMDLMGTRSWNKFVPECYKVNEASVRLAVLQGLMDTDGTVSRKGTSVQFCTASPVLADDVVFLVRSLGGIVKRHIKKPFFTYKGQRKQGRDAHILNINLPPDIMPFRLKRKADLVVAKTRYKPTRYIVAVESIGEELAQCIAVDHPSHLYVTDDFIVTHNSASAFAAAMELRRLGLAKKPVIACLKANVGQLAREAAELYPDAKILSTAESFDAKNRQKTLAKIATGDYDMIFMTHEHLDFMKMKPETQAAFIQKELDEVITAKLAALAQDGKDAPSVKELEKAEADIKGKLEEALNETRKDDTLYFEDSGIDQLFIDEFHHFKSLPARTKNPVKGVPTARSDRATNMYMRSNWLMERQGGRGLVALTGTPISNSMAEMYVMQKFLQEKEMNEAGISNFDDWANQFGETETKQEYTMTGQHKPVTRFSKFVNIPELLNMARQVIDVVRADNTFKPDGTPMVVRPKRKDDAVVSPPLPGSEEFLRSLQTRAASLRRNTMSEDNMLKICSDARKYSVDMRLVHADAEDHPDSKLNKAVDNIVKIWKANPTKSQFIFSDVGVHETDANSFTIYNDMIEKLVTAGVPREKIMNFGGGMTEKARESAIQKLKTGEALFAIGGTKTLGTGVNAQKHIIGIHHLDVPWKPADIEQREGRGWRAGNLNKELQIVKYVAQPLDQFFWGLVGRKAKFIKDIVVDKNPPREMVEEDDESISPDRLAALASGDPRKLEKVNLEYEVKKLSDSYRRHENEQRRLKKSLEKATEQTTVVQEKIKQTKEFADYVAKWPKEFKIQVGDVSFDNRAEAEQALENEIKNLGDMKSWETRDLGEYLGMRVFRRGAKTYFETPDGRDQPTGDSLKSIEYNVRHLTRADAHEAELEQINQSLPKVRQAMGKVFAGEEELKKKQQRIKDIEQAFADESKPATPDVTHSSGSQALDEYLADVQKPNPKGLTITKKPQAVIPPAENFTQPSMRERVKEFGKAIKAPKEHVKLADRGEIKGNVVEGVAVGPFVIHKTGTGKNAQYNIIHVGTGLTALRADTQDVAKTAAHAMSRKGDWSFTDAGGFVGEVRDHALKVKQALNRIDLGSNDAAMDLADLAGIGGPQRNQRMPWNFNDVLAEFRIIPNAETARKVLRYCEDDTQRYARLTDADSSSIEYELTPDEDDVDHYKVLANFYADHWNQLEDAGLEPSEEGLQKAADELSSGDWVVFFDDDEHEWVVTHADAAPHVVKYANDNDFVYRCPKCGGVAYAGSPVKSGRFQGYVICSRCGNSFAIVNRHQAVAEILRYERKHAPKGGVTINGKFYKGGRWIPSSEMAKATPKERKALEAKSGVPVTSGAAPAVKWNAASLGKAAMDKAAGYVLNVHKEEEQSGKDGAKIVADIKSGIEKMTLPKSLPVLDSQPNHVDGLPPEAKKVVHSVIDQHTKTLKEKIGDVASEVGRRTLQGVAGIGLMGAGVGVGALGGLLVDLNPVGYILGYYRGIFRTAGELIVQGFKLTAGAVMNKHYSHAGHPDRYAMVGDESEEARIKELAIEYYTGIARDLMKVWKPEWSKEKYQRSMVGELLRYEWVAVQSRSKTQKWVDNENPQAKPQYRATKPGTRKPKSEAKTGTKWNAGKKNKVTSTGGFSHEEDARKQAEYRAAAEKRTEAKKSVQTDDPLSKIKASAFYRAMSAEQQRKALEDFDQLMPELQSELVEKLAKMDEQEQKKAVQLFNEQEAAREEPEEEKPEEEKEPTADELYDQFIRLQGGRAHLPVNQWPAGAKELHARWLAKEAEEEQSGKKREYQGRGGVLRYGAYRVPKGQQVQLADGRIVKGGGYISQQDLSRATTVEQKKLPSAKSQAKERGKRDVDRHKLGQILQTHGHHELDPKEMKSTKSAFRALTGHHKELVVHRLEELANGVQASLERLPDNAANAKVRQGLGRKLRGIGHMLEWADAKKGQPQPAIGGTAAAINNKKFNLTERGKGVAVEKPKVDTEVQDLQKAHDDYWEARAKKTLKVPTGSPKQEKEESLFDLPEEPKTGAKVSIMRTDEEKQALAPKVRHKDPAMQVIQDQHDAHERKQQPKVGTSWNEPQKRVKQVLDVLDKADSGRASKKDLQDVTAAINAKLNPKEREGFWRRVVNTVKKPAQFAMLAVSLAGYTQAGMAETQDIMKGKVDRNPIAKEQLAFKLAEETRGRAGKPRQSKPGIAKESYQRATR